MNLPPIHVGIRRRWLVGLLAAGLVQAGCVVGTAMLMQRALDGALSGADGANPLVFLAGMVALAVIAAGCRWLERHNAERLGQDYVHELRLLMFRALAAASPSRRSSEGRGAVPLRFMSDLNALRQWISLGQARLVVASLLLVATLGYVMTINPLAALAVCVILAGSGISTALLGQRLESAVIDSRRQRGRLASLTAEKVASLSTIIGFGRLHSEVQRLRLHSQRLCDAMNARAFWVGSLRAVNELGVGLAVATVLTVGLFQVHAGEATAGAILAAVSVVALMSTPIRDLGRVHEYWKAAKVSRHKLVQLVGADPAPSQRRNRSIEAPRGRIDLVGLSPREAAPAIDAVIEPGSKVVLLGPNGVGKTTLLWTLAGIRRAASGRVGIDGQPAHRLDRRSLQRSIGIASPDLPLVRGTLRRNLRYRAPDATDEEMHRACKAAGLCEALGPWPEVLQRRIEEGGTNLSDGERARVQLARALVGQPAILVLDELDSHLDEVGRSLLRDLIERYRGTVVYTTHDAGTAALADVHWRLDERGLRPVDGPPAVVPIGPLRGART